MHDKSWMTALPNDNFEVQSLLFKHNDRIRRGGNEYNWEFGGYAHHLPSFKFGGIGLSRFKNQEKVGVPFTGAIHLLEAQEQNMRVITIADRSGSLKVMVIEKIRQGLNIIFHQQSAADDRSSNVSGFDSSRRFLATIRMFESDRKYFVLTNLEPIDN